MGSGAAPSLAYGFVALRGAVTLGCTFFTFAGPPLRSALRKSLGTGRLRSQVSAGFKKKDRGSPRTRSQKPGWWRFILAENFLRFVLLGPIAGSRRSGMRLRHMRDPAHGGANPPLDPDYPAAPKCGTHEFSTIGGSGERSFPLC